MGLALTKRLTAEGEAALKERVEESLARRGLTRGGNAGMTIPGWEDMPSLDEWAKMGASFTNVGINFASGRKAIRLEDFAKLGKFVGGLNNVSKLWVGDWCAYGQARFGYKRSELAALCGLDPETIDNYASIGRKVPVSNRLPGMTPRHLAAVASCDRGMQEKLLTIASKHDWTSDMLRNKKRAVIEFGQPLDDTPIFPADLKQIEIEYHTGRTGVTTVTRKVRHADEYKLALLRDAVESLPDLFEVKALGPNTEIEITIVGSVDSLLALLAADLPDEQEVGIKVVEVISE